MQNSAMFRDERIDYACGGMYRTGILLAVLYAILFAGIRLLYAGGFSGIGHYLTEGAIILSGGVILLVGGIRWGFGRDERTDFERHRYYLRAGKVFLVVALAGYALSIPLRARVSNDLPVNELIIHLETLGCVYFFYAFKRQGVSFNYTFIQETGWGYYRRVLLNTVKLAGILLVPFWTAAVVDLVLYQSFVSYMAILFGYLYSAVGLGADYFLLSLLEKLNYDEESPGRLGRGTAVAWLLMAICRGWMLLWQALASASTGLAMTGELPLGLTVGQVLAATSYAARRVSFPLLMVTALTLCFLMEQFGHSRRMRWGVGGYLAVQAMDLGLYHLRAAVMVFLERHAEDSGMAVRRVGEMTTYWSFAIWLISLVFTGLWIYGLIRDCGASRLLWVTLGLVVACQAVGLFFGSQSMNLAYTLTVGGGELVAIVGRWIILNRKNPRSVDAPEA